MKVNGYLGAQTAKRGTYDGRDIARLRPVATFPTSREVIANTGCRKFPIAKLCR